MFSKPVGGSNSSYTFLVVPYCLEIVFTRLSFLSHLLFKVNRDIILGLPELSNLNDARSIALRINTLKVNWVVSTFLKKAFYPCFFPQMLRSIPITWPIQVKTCVWVDWLEPWLRLGVKVNSALFLLMVLSALPPLVFRSHFLVFWRHEVRVRRNVTNQGRVGTNLLYCF